MLEQIKELIEQNKDNEEVQSYLRGFVTLEGAQKYLEESEEGKKWLQAQKDAHFTKGLDTWKQKTLPDLMKSQVDEEISKRFPAETEEQKQLAALREEVRQEREARTREKLVNQATKHAVEQGLPVDLVEHFIGQDEESTFGNLEKLSNVWQSHAEKLKSDVTNQVLKDNGRETPAKQDGGESKSDMNSVIRRLAGRE